MEGLLHNSAHLVVLIAPPEGSEEVLASKDAVRGSGARPWPSMPSAPTRSGSEGHGCNKGRQGKACLARKRSCGVRPHRVPKWLRERKRALVWRCVSVCGRVARHMGNPGRAADRRERPSRPMCRTAHAGTRDRTQSMHTRFGLWSRWAAICAGHAAAVSRTTQLYPAGISAPCTWACLPRPLRRLMPACPTCVRLRSATSAMKWVSQRSGMKQAQPMTIATPLPSLARRTAHRCLRGWRLQCARPQREKTLRCCATLSHQAC